MTFKMYLFSVLGFPFGSFYSFALLKFCIFSFISSMFFSFISEQSYSSCFKIFANSNPWVILGLVFINGVFWCLYMSNNLGGFCSFFCLIILVCVLDIFYIENAQFYGEYWFLIVFVFLGLKLCDFCGGQQQIFCLVLFTLIGLLGICSTCGV